MKNLIDNIAETIYLSQNKCGYTWQHLAEEKKNTFRANALDVINVLKDPSPPDNDRLSFQYWEGAKGDGDVPILGGVENVYNYGFINGLACAYNFQRDSNGKNGS